MLKRYLLLLFFIPLLFPHPAFAQDESVTFTTYYPSPYGDYNDLTTNNFTASTNVTLATEPGSRVGIGTTTPIYQMQVLGAGQTTANLADAGASGGTLLLSDTGASVNNGGALVFAANTNQRFAAIKGVFINSANYGQGFLTFSTRKLATDLSLTEHMRIDNNGNVGIGTTAPGARKLKVQGDIEVTGNIYGSGTVPPGAIMAFDLASCPSGWSPYISARDRTVIGSGSLYSRGQTGGEAQHTLTISEMPSHYHTTTISGAGYERQGYVVVLGGQSFGSTSLGTDSKGGNQPHNNMPPYVALLYCRKD